MSVYILTKDLNVIDRLEKALNDAGYVLDSFNNKKINVVGIYTYKSEYYNEKSYGYLYEGGMIGNDERFSWILHRKECKTEQEFIDSL